MDRFPMDSANPRRNLGIELHYAMNFRFRERLEDRGGQLDLQQSHHSDSKIQLLSFSLVVPIYSLIFPTFSFSDIPDVVNVRPDSLLHLEKTHFSNSPYRSRYSLMI